MNDGLLSQEEIDALLKGESQPEVGPDHPEEMIEISAFEKDALGEVGNISMGTAATTLSTLLRRKVSITTPNVFVTTSEQLRSDYPLPYVIIEVQYTAGLSGTNVLIIKEEDACVIANLMMGGEGKGEDVSLDELQLSAVGEAMNQMMGSATTSLSSMFNSRIDIAPPKLTLIHLGKQDFELSTDYSQMVSIKFKMEIENLVDSEIMQIIPMESVKTMLGMLIGNAAEESTLEAVMEEKPPIPHPQESYPSADIAGEELQYAPRSEEVWNNSYAAGFSDNNIPSGVKKGEQVAVQPIQFAPLRETEELQVPQNIGLIMDVPLDVSVELGKTRKTIKEILDLHQGSIIQLDKLAGEPVDLMVNGKLIAKGEVVVIDESYGIRITTIISPMDRMNRLQ